MLPPKLEQEVQMINNKLKVIYHFFFFLVDSSLCLRDLEGCKSFLSTQQGLVKHNFCPFVLRFCVYTSEIHISMSLDNCNHILGLQAINTHPGNSSNHLFLSLRCLNQQVQKQNHNFKQKVKFDHTKLYSYKAKS